MTTIETPVRCLTPGLITHAMCADDATWNERHYVVRSVEPCLLTRTITVGFECLSDDGSFGLAYMTCTDVDEPVLVVPVAYVTA